MFPRFGALIAVLLLCASAWADSSAVVLRAYGPGGPHHVIQEAATLYRKQHGVTVGVVKASPVELAKRLREDGDVYFTGAEYMLEDFVRENPGVIDMASVEKLYPRRVGILVRKGNPLGIEGVDCLREEGADLLAAERENMEPLFTVPGEPPPRVAKLVLSGFEGTKAWRAMRELDAWVTYKSWHVELEEESEFIEIPCGEALRHTMVAITTRTAHREEAQKFIDFLRSPCARPIFVEHGWE